MLPQGYLRRRQAQRVRGIEGQLVDLLSLTSNSLRSGWGFLQALETASIELPPPVSEELRQVLEEVSLGATPEQALNAFRNRIHSYDLDLVITAVLIQRRTGGNLAEMIDKITDVIRARLQLLGEVKVITSEARMSGWILALLP